MTLSEGIRFLVDSRGLGVLKTPVAINILSDYKAFEEYPSSKNILKNVISEGYLDKIAFFFENELPIGEAPKNYLNELYNKLGFRKDVAEYVLNSILEALDFEKIPFQNENSFDDHQEPEEKTLESTNAETHIEFQGISLSLTRDEICDELKKEGYRLVGKFPTFIELQGWYFDIKNATIRIFGEPNGAVGDISVTIEHTDYIRYKIDEERIIDCLKRQYGTPYKAVCNYDGCEELDGFLLFNKIDDSNEEELDYRWKIPGGDVQMTNIIGDIRIDYIDKLNRDRAANKRELTT